MFGTYRFLLATMVAAHHLLHWPHRGLGAFAVFGFYLLSGYLITMVLSRTYAWSDIGLARFVSNRALRVYPPYWVLAFFSLGVILAFPETAESLNPRLQVPGGLAQWRSNLVIFGLDVSARPRLVPPAWSLHVELVYYLSMGLLLSRRGWIVVIWFVASLAWTVHLVADGAGWQVRYFSVSAASIAFALGALIWFVSRWFAWRPPAWSAWLAFLVFFGHSLGAGLLWSEVRIEGFYVSLALAGLAVFCLKDLRTGGWLERMDRRLGDLSYPIFLAHWPVAAFLVGLFPGLESDGSVFAAAFAGSVIAALLVHAFVESPINRLRDRIRAARARPAP